MTAFPGLALVGCSGYTGPRSVVNEDPAVKIPEIQKATAKHDRSVAPQLVKDLDSDDAAVRLYSIRGLCSFYGDDRLGYEWTSDDRFKRKASIARWSKRVNGTPLASEPSTIPAESAGAIP